MQSCLRLELLRLFALACAIGFAGCGSSADSAVAIGGTSGAGGTSSGVSSSAGMTAVTNGVSGTAAAPAGRGATSGSSAAAAAGGMSSAPSRAGNSAAAGGGRSGFAGMPSAGGGPSSGGAAIAGTAAAGGGANGSPGPSAPAAGAMPSAGCGKPAPASQRYMIDVAGTMREYILAVPADYDSNRPYRLVFAWHPLGGSAQQTAGSGNNGYYGLRSASKGAAILVSPEGLAFNGGSLGWANTNGRDIEFLKAMIERFKAELCIDESRIFSTGFSFGGMMSYTVGCAGLARAIAPMAGNSQVSGCTKGTMPVAMMGFHGDDDTVVAPASGRAARDAFVQRNQCKPETMPVMPSWCDGVNQNNQPCSCVSYQGCAAGYPTIWCEFNGSHAPAPNSAATIWNFFSQF